MLCVALILVWSLAYEPKTPYEKCLQDHIEQSSDIYNNKIGPNPIHLAIESCEDTKEVTGIIMK